MLKPKLIALICDVSLVMQVAGTLSQGLGWLTMDENHKESRDHIRRQYTGSNVLLGM